ncbi:MAG: hypothetical protein Q4F92_07715 [Acidaminococcus sp.]|uniref:hypothetical protein n=1 Tax=Acidaminococcus sp. TaxID=1872103 RepID=UPI0026DF5650|nr:hypothetical protein [Acidaminococcus sp.]MDO5598216.1 hypothetical protein [Acidaminococcus sp.]
MEQHTRKQVLLSLALAGVLSLPALATAEAGTVRDLRQFPQLQAEKAAAGKPSAQTAGKGGRTKNETKKPAGTQAGKVSEVPDDRGEGPVKLAKGDSLRKTRPVDFVIQHGQLISEAIGDIDGDGVDEVVDLMGNPVVDGSSFMGDMYLVAREVNAANPSKVKYYYRPRDLGGYNAYLTLADVTGNGWPNIIIAAPSGGSGGMVSYRILDVQDGRMEEIFGPEENKGVAMVGTYLPEYQVKLSFPNLTQDIILDVSNEKEAYRNLNVYNADGSLKDSGLRPTIQNLSQLSALDVNGDGMDEVVTLQKVVGVTNSDPLGVVRTVWDYRAGGWQPRTVGFQAELYSRPTYVNTDKITGQSGYEIVSLKVATEDGAVEYPHFQKLDGKLAWKLNHGIEAFVRNHLKDLGIGSRLNLDYDVKYSGQNYASIMLLGLLTERDRSTAITRCFNFNVKTGEEVPLKAMVKPWGKFWKMVAKETAETGQTLTPKDVTSYYFDGDALGLLYGDQKEFDLEAEKVLPYLKKNLPGEVFVTSQSNDGNNSKNMKTGETKTKTAN